jgi:tartrate dehydratase beta subunit/fumarate hydratase class I family protein
MSREPIHLELPLSKEDIEPLRTGDVIRLHGTLYVARDAAHARMKEAIRPGTRGAHDGLADGPVLPASHKAWLTGHGR